MPDERLRAIRWGGELLAQISIDDTLPGKAMAEAKRIALTYPTPQLLEACLQSGATGLPPEWTAALFDALAFFDEIGGRLLGSARTRSDMKYTMRHFPDRVTIRMMSRASRLDEWLR